MLSTVGIFDGLTALFVIIFCGSFGAFLALESRKISAELLLPIGLSIFFAGLLYLGQVIDFFIILLTGENVENADLNIAVIMATTLSPAAFFSLYGGTKLLKMRIVKKIVPVYLIVCILLSILTFLYLDVNFKLKYPVIPGEDLIQIDIVPFSPFFITFLIIGSFYFSICGVGFLYRGIKTKGLVGKKFLFLSIGSFLYLICVTIDFVFILGYLFVLIRLFVIFSAILWYFGLRKEPEKTKEVEPKKEIKVEESIFRISKRRENISDEEILFYKEQEICLVCKGKTERLTYICPKCKVLYCLKCSEALSNLDNACWICNTPFDESKPSKPYTKEDEKDKKYQKRI